MYMFGDKEKIEFYNKNVDILVELTKAGVFEYGNQAALNNIRNHNVGESDYSKKSIIQPWTLWYLWKEFLTPWDYDIIKRIFRSKSTDSRKTEYQKIIHDCQERIRQIDLENVL